jgi:hypothetical protein
MVIKASAASEVRTLVEALEGDDDVYREAAIARLAVIGSRAVEKLTAAYAGTSDRVARLAMLRALEAIGDHRSGSLARQAIKEGGGVAVAAAGVLRALLPSRHEAAATAALDTLVAVALDRQAEHRLRLAAFEALQDMPGDVRVRVGQALAADPDGALRTGAKAADRDAAEAEAAWNDALEGRLPDDPRGLRDTLATRGATAPLNTLRKMIDLVRRKGDDVPRAQREGWLMLRGSLHQVLALRGSRVALYDLRESLEHGTGTLPVSFLAALHVLGDQSCLEALAAAYTRAGSKDEHWRHQLVSAFRAIARREKLTARHAAVKRLAARWPDAAALWSGDRSG